MGFDEFIKGRHRLRLSTRLDLIASGERSQPAWMRAAIQCNSREHPMFVTKALRVGVRALGPITQTGPAAE